MITKTICIEVPSRNYSALWKSLYLFLSVLLCYLLTTTVDVPNYIVFFIELTLQMQGRWFEARRYFLISETPLKCIKSDLLHGGGPGIILQNTTAISRL